MGGREGRLLTACQAGPGHGAAKTAPGALFQALSRHGHPSRLPKMPLHAGGTRHAVWETLQKLLSCSRE